MSLHHAHRILGIATIEALAAMASDMAAKAKVDFSAFEGLPVHPDLFLYTGDTITIDVARELAAWHGFKASIEGKPRLALIVAGSITIEAANALLKITEEPRPGNYFFFALPKGAPVPATLLSRLVTKEGEGHAQDPLITKFLAAPYAERQKIVQGLLKEYADEKRSKSTMAAFIIGCAEKGIEYCALHPHPTLAQNIERTTRYAYDRSTSYKMLLEYLSLSLPRFHV